MNYTNSNLPELIWETIQIRQKAPAIFFKHKNNWEEINYHQLGSMLIRMTLFLEEQDIKSGDRVALLSHNRFETIVLDLGLQSLGATLIPLDPALDSSHIKLILKKSKSTAIFVENLTLFEKHPELFSKMKQNLLSFEKINEEIPHSQWLLRTTSTVEMRIKHLEKITVLDPERPIAINYDKNKQESSLNHADIISDIQTRAQSQNFRTSDRFLIHLPLFNNSDRMLSTYLPLFTGSQMVFSNNTEALLETIREMQLSVIFTKNSGLLEDIGTLYQARLSNSSFLTKYLTSLALKYTQYKSDKNTTISIIDKLLEFLVLNRIKNKVGQQLRLLVSETPVENKELAIYFDLFNIKITINNERNTIKSKNTQINENK